MGSICSISRSVSTSFDNVPRKIIMMGLENSGKTQLLYSWKIGSQAVERTIPTREFNVETVTSPDGIFYAMWDLSGKTSFRMRRRQYFHGAEGLIYVIDSSTCVNLEEARQDLTTILGESELSGLPLLIIATKQDLKGAMSAESLSEILDMRHVLCRRWAACGVRSLEEDGNSILLKKLDQLMYSKSARTANMCLL